MMSFGGFQGRHDIFMLQFGGFCTGYEINSLLGVICEIKLHQYRVDFRIVMDSTEMIRNPKRLVKGGPGLLNTVWINGNKSVLGKHTMKGLCCLFLLGSLDLGT